MTGPVLAQYRALVGQGGLEADPAQESAAERLDLLGREFGRPARPSGLIARLFGAARPSPPRGVYLHGDVGRGKTMLMDMFQRETTVGPRRRMHFHAFMTEIHEKVHAVRASGLGDPISHVAASIIGDARLLCLDELHVVDITDAMLVSRLFGALFERGLVLVATSNAAPEELYAGGLNRELFLPFVALLRKRLDIVRLAARHDYRLAKLSGAPVYHVPLDTASRQAMDEAWRDLTGAGAGETVALDVKGRRFVVPQAARGVARFGFDDLCGRPYGAGDYLALAREFHTVLIDGITRFDPEARDLVRRFVLLVDALYDHRVKLVVSAEAEPHALLPQEAGEFARTASRLVEMGSRSYLAAPHGPPETDKKIPGRKPRDNTLSEV